MRATDVIKWLIAECLDTNEKYDLAREIWGECIYESQDLFNGDDDKIKSFLLEKADGFRRAIEELT